ncbi:hypothetical protein PanWU01x14_131490, partial [Parasponia andersonii]
VFNGSSSDFVNFSRIEVLLVVSIDAFTNDWTDALSVDPTVALLAASADVLSAATIDTLSTATTDASSAATTDALIASSGKWTIIVRDVASFAASFSELL